MIQNKSTLNLCANLYLRKKKYYSKTIIISKKSFPLLANEIHNFVMQVHSCFAYFCSIFMHYSKKNFSCKNMKTTSFLELEINVKQIPQQDTQVNELQTNYKQLPIVVLHNAITLVWQEVCLRKQKKFACFSGGSFVGMKKIE